MASRYSPYTAPSVDSASDYSPEQEPTTTTNAPQTTKRRARGSMTAEERRDARAHRNRLAAQCSRDRKKAQFEGLSKRVNQLEEENRSLRLGLTTSQPAFSTGVNATIMEENRQLRERVQQLEMAWQNMTKILGAMSIPVPSSQPSTSTARPDVLATLPLSPAPTTSSPKSEPIFDEPSTLLSEPTCELAAGGPLGTLFGDSIIGGTEAVGTTTNHNITSPTTSTSNLGGQWDSSLLLSTPLNDGYNEMDRLLSILPSPTNDVSLSSILSSNNEDWAWLNDGY